MNVMIASDLEVMLCNPVVAGTRITVESLLERLAAGTLGAEERAELADYLLDSLGSGDELAAVQAEWLEVAHRRIDEIRSGNLVGVPAEDVLEILLKRQR